MIFTFFRDESHMITANNSGKINIHQLLPGDIIMFNVFGVPHSAIYSPQEGKQGDLIQMSYGASRSGCIKSTLSQQLKVKGRDVMVFRHKHLDGQAIANQAECWLRQGIVFDEVRLAHSIYDYGIPQTSTEYNILEYLKYAARRETMPIKVHEYPYNYTSFATYFGLGMLFPEFRYGSIPTYFFSKLATLGTGNIDRPKGMSCILFVLTCIAAVALRDEVQPVTPETGWVSLKNSRMPSQNSNTLFNTLRQVKSELDAKEIDAPGLEHIFSEEQIRQFDLDRITKKLSAGIASINPHQPSPHEFMQNLIDDQENWLSLGPVDPAIVKEFDREAFHQECEDIQQQIEENRGYFFDDFGAEIFNRDPDQPEREFVEYRRD